jgi:hypothetical protein
MENTLLEECRQVAQMFVFFSEIPHIMSSLPPVPPV